MPILWFLILTLVRVSVAEGAAPPHLPTVIRATDTGTGQVLYTARRTALYSEGRLMQADVSCTSPAGDSLGRYTLLLGDEHPELEWQTPSGRQLHLSHTGERAVVKWRVEDGARERTAWPKIRSGDLIADELLDFLQRNLTDIVSGELDDLVLIMPPAMRRQTYTLKAQGVQAEDNLVHVVLERSSWFAGNEENMRLTFERSGRLLAYRGPSFCPALAEAGVIVDVRYRH